MPLNRILSAGFLLLALTACGGGGDGGSPAATLTVTPALGKVQGGTVRLLDLQGNLLALGHLGSDGSVALGMRALPAGFVVELVGGEGVWYFDEGIGSYRPLVDGQVLHAVSATARGSVTVTALTEVMYQRALVLAGGGALTQAPITQAENELRTLLGIASTNSLLAVPEVVDSPQDLPASDTWAGQHAGLLAAWAALALETREATEIDCRSNLECAPLPGLIATIAADFADGSLDSQAGSTPLATPYAGTGDPVAHLAGALDEAEAGFRARALAARSAFGTDRLIGDHYAGRYTLSCRRGLAVTESPVTVDVAPDGSFDVQTPHGRYRLAAGNSFARVSQQAGQTGLMRTGIVVPSGLMATGNAPVADGLSISIPPPTIGNELVIGEETSAALVLVSLSSFGLSQIRAQDVVWSCGGVALGSEERLRTAARLAGWLPDGTYTCEENGGPLLRRFVTVNDGTLAFGAQRPAILESEDFAFTYADDNYAGKYLYRIDATGESVGALPPLVLADYPAAWETQDGPLGFEALDHLGHVHTGDAVAATLYPRQSLWLSVPPGELGAPVTEGLRIYRSLVTGQGFFELVSAGVTLRHCQRAEPDLASTFLVNVGWFSYVPPSPPPGCSGTTTFC